MDDLRKYLTVREAATRLDISEESVRDLINEKELKAVKIGQWRIKPDELERFIRSRSNL
ncbi:MAG: helix-turn-helix domain-containing protein [Candidatus Omnitrophota bacterium]